MPGPPPAVARTRLAVRRALVASGLADPTTWDPAADPPPDAPLVLVACSGGADSLALAAATAFVAPRLGLRAAAVTVDHGLQPGSPQVAAAAAATCRALGLDPAEVRRASVDGSDEAAARQARYAALLTSAEGLGAAAVLLGHTLDDQAEQVLLGLARGSGARSLAGMPRRRPLGDVEVVRPFLEVDRATPAPAGADQGLTPWQDPHNAEPRFARVRVRRALADLEHELGPGLSAALARTADLLRDDADALDEVSGTAYLGLGHPPWEAGVLADLPRAVRTRLWRRLAHEAGSAATDLTSEHLLAVDALVTDWHGQGPVHLPGGVRAGRTGGRVWLGAAIPSTMGQDDRDGPAPASDDEGAARGRRAHG